MRRRLGAHRQLYSRGAAAAGGRADAGTYGGARLLAYITGTVDQELLLRNEL
jgi:hypothetical protein